MGESKSDYIVAII